MYKAYKPRLRRGPDESGCWQSQQVTQQKLHGSTNAETINFIGQTLEQVLNTCCVALFNVQLFMQLLHNI